MIQIAAVVDRPGPLTFPLAPLTSQLSHRTGFSFDGGPSLDFAEAALLIQSSACVYSKKVEYLHTLVYQALEAVKLKRKKEVGLGQDEGGEGDDDGPNNDAGHPGAGAKKGRGRGHNRDLHDLDDTLEGFLLCGHDELDEVQACDPSDIDLGAQDDTAEALVYHRPPATLLALEDHANNTGSGSDGDGGVHRLSLCHVHLSGALLLDYRDGEMYDSKLRPLGAAKAAPLEFQAPPPPHVLPSTTMAAEGGAPTMAPSLPAHAVVGADGKAVAGEEDDDDDDNGGATMGGGDEDDDDEDHPRVPQQPTLHPGAPHPPAPHALPLHPVALAPGVDGGVGARVREEGVFDPWTPLDPNSASTLPIKPMVVKRPKSTAAVAKALAAKARSSQGALHTLNPHSSRGALKHVPELVHQEFAYASELLLLSSSAPSTGQGQAKRVKRGTAAQRVLGGLMIPHPTTAGAGAGGGAGQAPLVAAGAAVFDLRDAAAQNHQGQYEDQEDDDDDNGGGWGGGGEDDDDDDEGKEGALAHRGGLDASDILDGIRARPLPIPGEAEGGEQSYEDLCRAHIDTMLSAAAARAVSPRPFSPPLPLPLPLHPALVIAMDLLPLMFFPILILHLLCPTLVHTF